MKESIGYILAKPYRRTTMLPASSRIAWEIRPRACVQFLRAKLASINSRVLRRRSPRPRAEGYNPPLPVLTCRRDLLWSDAHSARKDVIGSALVARRAGGRLASVAVTIATVPTPMSVIGSRALTPYNRLSSTPPSARAHPSPIATPITVIKTPCVSKAHRADQGKPLSDNPV
jgi:hypothetical protein